MSKLIPGMPYYPLEPDMLVFAYLGGITLIAGALAGMTPAVESLRVDLAASIKGQEGLLGARRSRPRSFLVGAQVAMSLILRSRPACSCSRNSPRCARVQASRRARF